MTLLEGKTAVVTGGAQGIGLEIARTFIAEGARVVIGDINDEAGAAAVAELGGEELPGRVGLQHTGLGPLREALPPGLGQALQVHGQCGGGGSLAREGGL